MYEDYTVLTLKRLGGDAWLQMLAVCLLSILLSIAIPAKYKVTESMTYSYVATTRLPTLLVVSVIILVDCTACFHG